MQSVDRYLYCYLIDVQVVDVNAVMLQHDAVALVAPAVLLLLWMLMMRSLREQTSLLFLMPDLLLY